MFAIGQFLISRRQAKFVEILTGQSHQLYTGLRQLKAKERYVRLSTKCLKVAGVYETQRHVIIDTSNNCAEYQSDVSTELGRVHAVK